MTVTNSPRRGCSVARLVASLLATVALAATVSLTGHSSAEAYTYTGCKWPSSNVSYKNTAAGDYYSTGNLAANSWTQLTDLNMSLVTSSNLHVYSEFTGMDGVEGRSAWTCSGSSTVSANARWNTYYTINYSYGAKRAVICHELGHATGLGHSSVGGAIMSASASGVYNTYGTLSPQSDDINGINNRY